MSMYATPILYLNMSGEMLYVLRQRLKAQRIDVDKTIQVLDDVTTTLLNPTILSSIFKETAIATVASLRPTLECAALSSIMRLDTGSMNKLFDLMTMLVKYQLTAATGPREVVLLTLNHTDAMHDMVTDPTAQKCVELVHQMVVDFYGNLSFNEVWKARNDCLKELEPYCVRVSILLRLGLQNEDASFNITSHKYDEKYEENKDTLANQKIKDINPDKFCDSSFDFCGNRGTLLGRNIYAPTYGMTEKNNSRQQNMNFIKDCGSKGELGMLATQLGTETIHQRPFSLNLFSNEDVACNNDVNNTEANDFENNKLKTEKANLNEDYKSKLDSIYANFFEDEREKITHSMNLLELLDEIEQN